MVLYNAKAIYLMVNIFWVKFNIPFKINVGWERINWVLEPFHQDVCANNN